MEKDTTPTGVGGHTDNNYEDNDNLSRIENAKMTALVAEADSHNEQYPQATFDTVASFRGAMRVADHPALSVKLPAEAHKIYGAVLALPLGKGHLNTILSQLEAHVVAKEEDNREFMSNVRYTVQVDHWSHRVPEVSFALEFDDSRIRGAPGEGFIGYINADGDEVLWNRD